MLGYTKSNGKKLVLPTFLPLVFLLAASLVLSACVPAEPASQSPQDNPEEATPTEAAADQDLPRPVPERTPKALPNPITGPIDIPETPIVGEVPEGLLNDILADLENNQGRSPQDAILLRAQSITWSDGSLGCPVPGEMYTMALVDGYWIQIQAGEDIYDYRASQNGYFKLCSNALGLPGDVAPTE